MRHADCCRLHHLRMFYQDRLYLRRAEPFACNFDGVIRTSQNVPQPIRINRRKIAMCPDVFPAAPVSIEISLIVLPETARHANPGRFDDQFTHRIPHRLTVFIEHIGIHARTGRRKGARLERQQWIARNNPPADFRPTGIVDDGNS